ncbi:MAG TPA: 3-oxoacyl-ACP reductase [Micromonosporaceae bacterium]|nr:3-oxoacyl-ACP reductase [Micromonosporaceae bacterium]
MSDRYTTFANSTPGRAIVKRFGLPSPPVLRRYQPGDPPIMGPVILGGAGRARDAIASVLAKAGVELADQETGGEVAALVYDGSDLTEIDQLRDLYRFFHPLARSLHACGRVVVLGTPVDECRSPEHAAVQQALEGFVRSVGKEFGRGVTSQLVTVSEGAESNLESTLRFLLSAKSAYVSGQVIRVTPAAVSEPEDWARPLAGKVALVTGAARGIGEAIAQVLARDGARVVCLDVPAAGDALAGVANSVRGEALQLDLTSGGAPTALNEYLATRHGGVDIVVHNAGITRDKTLARMTEEQWDAVLAVNLAAPQRITAALLAAKAVRTDGRIVMISSVSGIAGNRGQTNYATSKAGLIGLVQAQARQSQKWSITVNAVAPGFIETAMTAAMPVVVREAGRRMNSMAQGGLPVDVAETVSWLASPASGGITGNVVRVCGQALLGR